MGRPRIEVYRGYGTAERLLVRGRVLEDRGLRRASPHDSRWTNLGQTLRRFLSREIPHARVRVAVADAVAESVCDEEGHFATMVAPDGLADRPAGWHPTDVELVEPGRAAARGLALVPDPEVDFGIVTDIDDTVIRTDVARVTRMVVRTLFGSAHTRLPFPGVGAFFRALTGGGPSPRPLFYVSSGPWNLHDVIAHFFELHGLPLGPIELRDWGPLSRELQRSRHREHKLVAIRRIFGLFPDLPFVLVGDSGQDDPEVYRDLVHEHPRRVPAVYIRNVRRDPLRERTIRDLAGEVESAGSALVLADDTLAAARHAAGRGWIADADLDAIAAETTADRGARRHDEARTAVVDERG